MTRKARIAIVAVAIAALPALAAAQPAPQAYSADPTARRIRKPDHKPRHDRMAKIIARYDMNGDGKLNQAEWRAARHDRMSKMVRRFDRDQSGDVSRIEARVKPESRLFRFFSTIDANRNGRVTKAELMATKDIKWGRGSKGKRHGKRRYLRQQL